MSAVTKLLKGMAHIKRPKKTEKPSFANLVVFEKLFDKYRKQILQSRLLMVEGILQKEGEVTHVSAGRNISGRKEF